MSRIDTLRALHEKHETAAFPSYTEAALEKLLFSMRSDLLALAEAAKGADLSCWSTACVKQCTCGRKALREALARLEGRT